LAEENQQRPEGVRSFDPSPHDILFVVFGRQDGRAALQSFFCQFLGAGHYLTALEQEVK
jgi:hypothetical protein